MPNPRLYGFRYLGPMTGKNPQRPIRYRVASAYAVALNIGDVVEEAAGGTCILSPPGSAVLSMLGVIVGIGPYWDGVKMTMGDFLPANTTPGAVNFERESFVYVMPAANNLFEAVCGTLLAAPTRAGYLTTIGNNIDHMNTPVANKNWPELDAATAPAAAAAQWRIMDFSRTALAVDWAALYVPLIVSGNEIATPPAAPLAGI